MTASTTTKPSPASPAAWVTLKNGSKAHRACLESYNSTIMTGMEHGVCRDPECFFGEEEYPYPPMADRVMGWAVLDFRGDGWRWYDSAEKASAEVERLSKNPDNGEHTIREMSRHEFLTLPFKGQGIPERPEPTQWALWAVKTGPEGLYNPVTEGVMIGVYATIDDAWEAADKRWRSWVVTPFE